MKHTSFLFLCLFIWACDSNEPVEESENDLPNQITLIFKNPNTNATYYIPGTDSQSVSNVKALQGYPIEGVDDKNILQYYGFDDTKEIDTLVIPTKRKVVELKFAYNAIDRLTYFFQRGDTVFVDYYGNKPFAQILNREEEFVITNFALYQRDSLYNVDFLASDKYSNYSFTLNAWHQEMAKTGQNIDLATFQENFKNSQLQELEKQYGIQKDFLDSLENTGKISSNQRNAVLTDTYWTLKVADKQSSTPEGNSAVDRVLNDIERQLPSLKTKNDSHLLSLSYQRYFRALPSITYKPSMIRKEGQGYGSSTTNDISLYDSVRNSSLFTPKEKLVLQYAYVDQILSNTSAFEIENRLKYLIRFKNDFNDSTLFNRLVDKYDIKFEIDDALRLVDANGNETDLKSIIAEQKTKIVYVDFWASWCAPCIREMPSSKALQAELANEDITFIYLSTDRKPEPWAKAINKHELNTGLHYRILNADNSKAMEELSVQFIPRYMIYNKEGALINKDAPRPSEKEILINEFSKYLGGQ